MYDDNTHGERIKIESREQTNIKFLGFGIDKQLDLKVNTSQILIFC